MTKSPTRNNENTSVFLLIFAPVFPAILAESNLSRIAPPNHKDKVFTSIF